MSQQLKHITVCVCTYKRADLLEMLLRHLLEQETAGQFTYSIVVVDNDSLQSAKEVVAKYVRIAPLSVMYSVEPRQNIALARNRALEQATGELVALIDDDEFPNTYWLLTLFKAYKTFDADGVLGPVHPHYGDDVPKWVIKGHFYERQAHCTGWVIEWQEGRTGNVLFRKAVVSPGEQAFRPEFRSGEDQDFFRRMINKGHKFVWCNEAVVSEVVPPVRWRRTIMLRRALLRGANTALHPRGGHFDVLKSLVAVPAYTIVLPLALLLGQHRFMAALVRLCDHLGMLLALVGINPIKEPYITE